MLKKESCRRKKYNSLKLSSRESQLELAKILREALTEILKDSRKNAKLLAKLK